MEVRARAASTLVWVAVAFLLVWGCVGCGVPPPSEQSLLAAADAWCKQNSRDDFGSFRVVLSVDEQAARDITKSQSTMYPYEGTVYVKATSYTWDSSSQQWRHFATMTMGSREFGFRDGQWELKKGTPEGGTVQETAPDVRVVR